MHTSQSFWLPVFNNLVLMIDWIFRPLGLFMKKSTWNIYFKTPDSQNYHNKKEKNKKLWRVGWALETLAAVNKKDPSHTPFATPPPPPPPIPHLLDLSRNTSPILIPTNTCNTMYLNKIWAWCCRNEIYLYLIWSIVTYKAT